MKIKGDIMNKKIQAIYQTLLILIWFIASQYIVGIITNLILGTNELKINQFYNQHQYVISLSAQILCLIGLLCTQHKEFKNVKDVVLSVRQIIKYILGGVGLWMLSSILISILIPYFPSYHEITELFTENEVILRFIVIVLIAPILEEYMFRDRIQSKLSGEFGTPIGILGQALLFGSLHSLSLQKIYAAIIGVILGVVKQKDGHIKGTVVMHMTVNFIGWFIGSYI